MPIIVDLAPVPADGAGLELCAVWLNSAADPADACAFRFVGDAIPRRTAGRAEIRQLMNRRRIIRRGTRTYDTFTLDLVSVTTEQAQWLRDHVEQLLCIRDHVGSKAYVTYLELPLEFRTGRRDRSDVKLTLDEITHTEAV
ncbi:hypothetical protein QWY28_13210 [Nocardioides sp. SOB77]|uniref:DUF4279 domain-containing protein n=1 Tax=Nocardioides oceani TaxID=3058369 RepID=A0ABT8FGU6_9ACTN|nr:hypothetical protein [Nocardioides oceani]MDN4173913.1 hypothetical protein [Nocardioides oceani]